MTLTIIIAIYLTGCVLAHGRAYGEFKDRNMAALLCTFSWCSVLAGWALWRDGKPFLRFRDPKKLHKKLEAKQIDVYDFERTTPEPHSWMN